MAAWNCSAFTLAIVCKENAKHQNTKIEMFLPCFAIYGVYLGYDRAILNNQVLFNSFMLNYKTSRFLNGFLTK